MYLLSVSRRARVLVAGFAAAALTAVSAPAFADTIHDDVAASGPTTIAMNGGTASTTIKYYVQAAGGCDVSSGSPSVWRVNVGGPAGVSASPSTVSFESCELRRSVTFTATSAGNRPVTLTHLSGPNLGGANAANPASFTLVVTAPTNTAPEVTVGGVSDDATYEHGDVPPASCSVADAEDQNPAATPVLSAVTGPLSAHGLGTQTATCSYVDSGGLSDSASVTYTIRDSEDPVLNTPGDQTLEATGPQGAEASWTGPSATDNVALAEPAACDVASPHTFDLGTHTVHCAATDVAGNHVSGSFTVTVNDHTGPSLSVSDDVTVEATGPAGAVASYDAPSASDLYDGPVSASCLPPSGSTFGVGDTDVTCTASDSSGNLSSAGFTVHVLDTTPPAVDVPSGRTAEATGPDGAAVSFSVTATDLVDGATDVSCDHQSGDVFPLGTTVVTCSSADTRGNTGTGSFEVSVSDTTAPALSLPGDINAGATSAAGAPVTYAASATDLVDPSVVTDCIPASGSIFAPGATTVNCSATDAAGNTAAGSFRVTVSFAFVGFSQPVDNHGVLNVVKGGQSVPLKWSIGNGTGGFVSALGVVQSVRQSTIACSSGTGTDDIEATTTGATGLRYDSTANQYIYNWQSPRGAGSCYRVSVTLTDGSVKSALFRTK